MKEVNLFDNKLSGSLDTTMCEQLSLVYMNYIVDTMWDPLLDSRITIDFILRHDTY
jgi:hypothetical protein